MKHTHLGVPRMVQKYVSVLTYVHRVRFVQHDHGTNSTRTKYCVCTLHSIQTANVATEEWWIQYERLISRSEMWAGVGVHSIVNTFFFTSLC